MEEVENDDLELEFELEGDEKTDEHIPGKLRGTGSTFCMEAKNRQ